MFNSGTVFVPLNLGSKDALLYSSKNGSGVQFCTPEPFLEEWVVGLLCHILGPKDFLYLNHVGLC